MIIRYKLYILTAALLVMAGESTFAITRVASRLNVLELYAGSATAQGSYNGIHPFDFVINFDLVDIDADKVYDPSLFLGVNYGQLIGGHFFVSAGFRFTDINALDTIELTIDTIFVPRNIDSDISWNQYDFDLNLNYYFTDISKNSAAPYVGIGGTLGLTRFSTRTFESEYRTSSAFRANFGFDFKLLKGKRSFITISSVNSLDIIASGDRPKYLNIGGAIKFWFRR